MEGEKGREMYRECMRNHAATLGTYADDGCGEFILDETRPGALFCGACGCHRNFHRKVVPEPLPRSQLFPASRERRPRRPRTRFTPDQSVRMGWFADRMGWRISRNATPAEELAVETFCSEIGVSRQTLVIWMHNHKAAAVAAAAAAAAPAASGASAPLLALPGADASADVTGDAATENDSVAME